MKISHKLRGRMDGTEPAEGLKILGAISNTKPFDGASFASNSVKKITDQIHHTIVIVNRGRKEKRGKFISHGGNLRSIMFSKWKNAEVT